MQKLFKLSTTAIAVMSTFAAFAQNNTETVEVTGSRIKSPGVYSNSPISSISAEFEKQFGKANLDRIRNYK